MKKGQPITEWATNVDMGEQEVTTAKIMLVTGVVLGALIGGGIVYLSFV